MLRQPWTLRSQESDNGCNSPGPWQKGYLLAEFLPPLCQPHPLLPTASQEDSPVHSPESQSRKGNSSSKCIFSAHWSLPEEVAGQREHSPRLDSLSSWPSVSFHVHTSSFSHFPLVDTTKQEGGAISRQGRRWRLRRGWTLLHQQAVASPKPMVSRVAET